MAVVKSSRATAAAVKSKTAVSAKTKAAAAAKATRTKVADQHGVTIKLSLAETIHLPYRPTSFKLRDMLRVVADVKRTQE